MEGLTEEEAAIVSLVAEFVEAVRAEFRAAQRKDRPA